MQQNGTNDQHGQHYPLERLTVQSATARLSPRQGLVRVSFDLTIDEAYDLSYRCNEAHQAGFAAQVSQAAFWARWGVPVNLANPTNQPLGIAPQRMAPDPGE